MSTPLSQASQGDGEIRTETTGSIGWLIVDNQPKRNALSLAMWRALPAALSRLDDDEAVRLIVLTGAGGRSFVAGADISEFAETRSTAEKAKAYDAINVAAFEALKTAVKPTVAMIRGHCLGGGLGLALACDLRLAATGAVFGIPAARLGIAYPLAAIADIVQASSASVAKRMLFTAERVTAEDALRLGLVDELTEPGDLEARTEALGKTIAANAPLTLRAAKRAVNAVAAGARPEAMAEAAAAGQTCFESADFKEGRNAFLEKRNPVFTGR
ncbi:MAG: enoyl-CoA hydratase/isomerase family protein [Roseibium sp.]|nr:enoyl-CoA hydratase/isomerase family protein [Roseibium sp.]